MGAGQAMSAVAGGNGRCGPRPAPSPHRASAGSSVISVHVSRRGCKSKRMERIILHMDMDAFYASVEQRDRPELRGKPVIVGADPRGRGVVSTCSYEARKFGVQSAMPIGEAYRRCPRGIFVPVNMSLYAAVSHQIMGILERFSPKVEPLSIDEAFLDMTGCEGLFGPPATMGARVKQEVLAETRLPCSVGVAPNKFLAKLATNLSKPDGLKVIARDRIHEILAPLDVRHVFGIGPRTARRLEAIGILTIGDLGRAPTGFLERELGPGSAEAMQALARGDDTREVIPGRESKQTGSERTFMQDISDAAQIRRHLLDLSMDVGRALRRDGRVARVIQIKIRTEDFVTRTRRQSLVAETDSDRTIFRVGWDLYRREIPELPIRLIGISASELSDGEMGRQSSLLEDNEAARKTGQLERVADSIRERYGLESLKPASLVEDQRRRGSSPGGPGSAPQGGRRPPKNRRG